MCVCVCVCVYKYAVNWDKSTTMPFTVHWNHICVQYITPINGNICKILSLVVKPRSMYKTCTASRSMTQHRLSIGWRTFQNSSRYLFHDNTYCFRSRFSFMSRSALGLTAFGDRVVPPTSTEILISLVWTDCVALSSDYRKYIDRPMSVDQNMLGLRNMLKA